MASMHCPYRLNTVYMGHMKKYKCPGCLSTRNVIKYGYRNKSHRFYCKFCRKHFSVNPLFIDRKAILSDHLDGIPFRKLGPKYKISPMTAWRICEDELKKLPNNNQFTCNYCNRCSSSVVGDGKEFNGADQEAGETIAIVEGKLVVIGKFLKF